LGEAAMRHFADCREHVGCLAENAQLSAVWIVKDQTKLVISSPVTMSLGTYTIAPVIIN